MLFLPVFSCLPAPHRSCLTGSLACLACRGMVCTARLSPWVARALAVATGRAPPACAPARSVFAGRAPGVMPVVCQAATARGRATVPSSAVPHRLVTLAAGHSWAPCSPHDHGHGLVHLPAATASSAFTEPRRSPPSRPASYFFLCCLTGGLSALAQQRRSRARGPCPRRVFGASPRQRATRISPCLGESRPQRASWTGGLSASRGPRAWSLSICTRPAWGSKEA